MKSHLWKHILIQYSRLKIWAFSIIFWVWNLIKQKMVWSFININLSRNCLKCIQWIIPNQFLCHCLPRLHCFLQCLILYQIRHYIDNWLENWIFYFTMPYLSFFNSASKSIQPESLSSSLWCRVLVKLNMMLHFMFFNIFKAQLQRVYSLIKKDSFNVEAYYDSVWFRLDNVSNYTKICEWIFHFIWSQSHFLEIQETNNNFFIISKGKVERQSTDQWAEYVRSLLG